MTGMTIFFIVLGLLILFGIVAVIAIKKKKGLPMEPDYKTYFILGITWIPLGLATDNSAFWIMGIVFMIIGLVNKDKWKNKKWSDLSDAEKKLKIVLITALGVLVLAGLVLMLLVNEGILNLS